MAHEVFICCSSRDMAIGAAVRRRLEERGVTCSPVEGLPMDFSREDRILSAIAESSVVVAVFSDQSSNLIQIKNQLHHAIRSRVPIIPFGVGATDRKEKRRAVPAGADRLEPEDVPELKEVEHLIEAVLSLLPRDASSGIGVGPEELAARAGGELTPDDTAIQADSVEADDPSPIEARRTALSAGQVQDFFRKHVTKGTCYFFPEIPQEKLANAREACELLPQEEVVVLVDCTVFGSAKNCILFTKTCLYNRMARETAKLPYLWFPDVRFEFSWWGSEIEASSGATIRLGGSGVDREELILVLYDIAQALKGAQSGGNTDSTDPPDKATSNAAR